MEEIHMARTRWNIKEVEKFVNEKSDCKLVSEAYKNQNQQMSFVCGCGNPFKTTWKQFCSDVTSKRQCNACGRARANDGRRHSIKSINEVLESSGSRAPNQKYVDVKTEIEVVCKCGNRFKTRPDNIINGSRRLCFECQSEFGNRYKKGEVPSNIKSKDTFLSELHTLRGNEYSLISEYTDVKTSITLEHVCGNEWVTNADKVLNAQQECPKCYGTANSKLTRAIDEWLDKASVEYITEYTFEDCKHERHLRFDYAVFNKGELQLLIEADGEQHFKPSNLLGGQESFELTKLRDSIKDNYCKDNKIKLLRIPYYEIDNVDSILQRHI